MQDIKSILRESDVRTGVPARCQRDVLARLAAHAAQSFGLSEEVIFDALMEREKLGSTAIGRGVAIPHARAPIERVRGVMFQLAEPVDFDAVDDVDVDLVFLLIAPEGDDAGHLKALSRVARRLRGEETQGSLRGALSAAALYGVLTGEGAAEAA
jgi:PTS system nitrogen regulatory IIA component